MLPHSPLFAPMDSTLYRTSIIIRPTIIEIVFRFTTVTILLQFKCIIIYNYYIYIYLQCNGYV